MTIQLQAKNRDGAEYRYSIHYDGICRDDLHWLGQFAQENLNVDPSVSVLFRAALSHYRSYLMAQATDINDIDALSAMIREHRNLLFMVAGKAHEAHKSKFKTKKKKED